MEDLFRIVVFSVLFAFLAEPGAKVVERVMNGIDALAFRVGCYRGTAFPFLIVAISWMVLRL